MVWECFFNELFCDGTAAMDGFEGAYGVPSAGSAQHPNFLYGEGGASSPVPPPLPSMPPPSSTSNVELHYHVSPVSLVSGFPKKKSKGVSPLAKKSSRRSEGGASKAAEQQAYRASVGGVLGHPFLSKGGSVDDHGASPWYGGACGGGVPVGGVYGPSRLSDPPLQHLFMGGPPSVGYCVGGRGEYLLKFLCKFVVLRGGVVTQKHALKFIVVARQQDATVATPF